MNAVTQAQLEELVMGALDARPITCGEVTKLVNVSGVDANRRAVERSLQRLVEKKSAGYIVAACERNGFLVNGKHYFDVELFEQHEWEDDDPFDGIA